MKKSLALLCFISLLWTNVIFPQVDFNNDLNLNDSTLEDTLLSLDEIIQIHKKYFDNARTNKDSLHIIYGYLFLANDYLDKLDYVKATEYLLEAENFANLSNNPLWKGRVSHLRACLYAEILNWEEAFKYYELALEQSEIASDSQNIAMSYEGLGSMYSEFENYDKALFYYKKALPLFEKFCSKHLLAIAYTNYANLLSYQKNNQEAIKEYEKVLTICRNNNLKNEEVNCLQNLADEYSILGDKKKALQLYYHCMNLNIQNDWLHPLITNYSCISFIYEDLGEYDSAFYYLNKYDELKDSIMGIDVRNKIFDLETKNEKEKKALQEQLSKSKLEAFKNKTKWRYIVSLIILFILILGLIMLLREKKRSAIEMKRNKENIKSITKTLVAKNAIIDSLSDQLKEYSKTESDNEQPKILEKNLFKLRILTKQDWAMFKIYFESVHPNYIIKLRDKITNLSEAEERLFLLLKLNLTRKEIKDILGISNDSVKKACYRLRKKINIESNTSLDEYIQNF